MTAFHPKRFADVGRTGVNPLVFWDGEQANRSIARAVDLADVLYPGHDHPFRITRSGQIEYPAINEITLVGAAPRHRGSTSSPSIRCPCA